MDRTAARSRLASGERFDLLVIGGGAVGLGTAVDAAARGLTVALLERGDFGGGTSSRSTKLIHGGVRYLRQGNLKLVREGLRERARLLRNAPHVATPLEFAVPCFGAVDALWYGAGLKLYDLLAAGYGLAPARLVGARELCRCVAVKGDRLSAGVVYRDAQFDDARLAIVLARTAHGLGACLLNYAPVAGLLRERSGLAGAEACDQETGDRLEVRARCVVNATGVFVDEVRRLEDASARPLVTVSQGIHLVLPRRFLPGDTALMVPKTSDGRVLFAIPWLDRVVIGTTDTPRPAAIREPRSLAEERAFLLDHARRYLKAPPGAADVLSVFAGLRPLVSQAGQANTAALSREHAISIGPSGLVSVTGGKWTTYRQMAEDVVDHALRVGRWEERACATADLRLHGGEDSMAARTSDEHAFLRYGSDASAVAALALDHDDLNQRLHPHLPYRAVEVVWQARHEMARTIEDVLARRTRALFLDAQAAIDAAPTVARILAAELGRPPAWERSQVEAFTALARGYVFGDPASVIT